MGSDDPADERDVPLHRILHALGDPTRLAMVRLMARGGEQPCGALACDQPKATISRHFGILRDAGLIRQRPQGTQRLHSLRREEIDARFPGLLDAILGADPVSP